jgi:hypothetical protein
VSRDFPSNVNKNDVRNGLYSVAKIWTQMMLVCKLLKRLVPRVGVEPTRPFGQRILSPLRWYLLHSTTRYQVVFTDVSAVKASYVRLGIST